ncbi:MAG TPA: TolC family protein [Nevskia sp.]|nr:TolC family protein [Nevskia sp.]
MSRAVAALLLLALLPAAALAEDAAAPAPETVLTLDDAREQALAHNPELLSGALEVGIARENLDIARSAWLPSLDANITAAGAKGYGRRDGAPSTGLDPRLAAGAINAPSVYDRAAAGITLSQKLTDFGRTSSLIGGARSALESEQDRYEDRRQRLLLQVTADYFAAREAQSAVTATEKMLRERSLLQDQISLLQKNKLKSELDVGFASVSVDQARLLILQQQSEVDAALARLCSDIGVPAGQPLVLADDGTVIRAPPPLLDPLLTQARARRPELKSLREQLDAARSYAKAQDRLGNPTLSLIGSAGTVPYGDDRLPENYAAGAVNLSIPIFDGGRLRAEARTARLRAQQAADALADAELAVTRDVRVAWLDASSSYQGIAVTRRLRSNAEHALELAASRYYLGLSSIVELNRAQLNEMDAEIAHIRALYQYQVAIARLAYEAGGEVWTQ